MAGEGRRTALSERLVDSEEVVDVAGVRDERSAREGHSDARVGQREPDRPPHIDVRAELRLHLVDLVLAHLAPGVARERPVRARSVPHVELRGGLVVELRALEAADHAPEGGEGAGHDEDFAEEGPPQQRSDAEAGADEHDGDGGRDVGHGSDGGRAVGAAGSVGSVDLTGLSEGAGHDVPHNRLMCGKSAYLGVRPTHGGYYSINAYACK
jgi:hypothetical protein